MPDSLCELAKTFFILSMSYCQSCTGPCCDATNCRFKSNASICRTAADHCDFDERCTGQSNQCPSNRYRLDGTPCENHGSSFCLRGYCNTANIACEIIYDRHAASGIKFCYDQLCEYRFKIVVYVCIRTVQVCMQVFW